MFELLLTHFGGVLGGKVPELSVERAFFWARERCDGEPLPIDSLRAGGDRELSEILRQPGNGFLNLYQQVGIGDLALAYVKVVIKARY